MSANPLSLIACVIAPDVTKENFALYQSALGASEPSSPAVAACPPSGA
jgi:hypothetical protein